MAIDFSRRDFIKTAGIVSSATLAGIHGLNAAEKTLAKYPKLEVLRMGIIGVGARGSCHVVDFLKIPGVEINAICDTNKRRAEKYQKIVCQPWQKRTENLYSR